MNDRVTSEMVTGLRHWAAERGYRVAWGSLQRVSEAQADILGRHACGELDDELYTGDLQPMIDNQLAGGATTVIMVAKPAQAYRVGFDLGDGETHEALLPPTYLGYRPTFEAVRQDLLAHGLPGARVEHLAGPHKAIAARLGLVRYGRNNITYAPGLGSWMQLCGYLSDAPLPEPQEPAGPALLEECEGCDRCRLACPTGAISDERVLLHAERCLTHANEHPGDWPDWVPPLAHHCLLGCLACQRACPANDKLPVSHSGVILSSDETRALLDGVSATRRIEDGIRKKLAWLGQPSAEAVLGRNLRALLGGWC